MLYDSHTAYLNHTDTGLSRCFCEDGPSEQNIVSKRLIKTTRGSNYKQYKKLQAVQTTQLKYLSGFTLIELLVTLCVLGILLMVAIPSFWTMILNNRISTNADTLVNALNYARGTALTQAMNIKVCPVGSPGSTTCGTDWSNGWIVVAEPASGASTLLKCQQNSGNTPLVSASSTQVLFDRYGLSTTQSNFTLCDSRGSAFARSVEVLATGYVQSGTTPGQAVWNNGALSCP
ncbi:GspH/FimT family pseudopilin [uncultured Legionella sp.]|uniref:GspH/FimT family pseudopilin n=1 Tax=uncultured Legionella sp. TaxID=210934 RepID=UPI0026354272|nr:GspH/FimT family pseudopilin [uncultured Legionella sp.]